MTYLLTDDLPSTVSVNSVPFEVETDFRLFVAFERDAFCERWGDTEALETLLRFYPGGIPADVQAALTAFFDFYHGGFFEPVDADGKPNYLKDTRHCIPYAFDTDDRRIYTAFWRQYGIDLSKQKLHWYSFRSLLCGLYEPDMETVVGYRAADLSGIRDDKQKKETRKLQKAYTLHRPGMGAGGAEMDWDKWRADKIAKLNGGE